MYLKESVISHFGYGTYGVAGDKVTVLADHGNVFIVENKAGLRFTVKKELLSEEKTDTTKTLADEDLEPDSEKPAAAHEPAPAKPPSRTPAKKQAQKKSKPLDYNQQQSLF